MCVCLLQNVWRAKRALPVDAAACVPIAAVERVLKATSLSLSLSIYPFTPHCRSVQPTGTVGGGSPDTDANRPILLLSRSPYVRLSGRPSDNPSGLCPFSLPPVPAIGLFIEFIQSEW